jgi:hypothetical protein
MCSGLRCAAALGTGLDTPLAANGALIELYGALESVLKPAAYPAWFGDWVSKEGQAVKLRWFELNVVPGLLQTEEYATALLTGRIGFNGDVDEAVAARLARQAILDRDEPPELFVVIDEAVLHRPVGGPDVMARQLKHLVEMAGPSTIVRVIPASTGVHDGLPDRPSSRTSRTGPQPPTWIPRCGA